jgi:hypothetical protein
MAGIWRSVALALVYECSLRDRRDSGSKFRDLFILVSTLREVSGYGVSPGLAALCRLIQCCLAH